MTRDLNIVRQMLDTGVSQEIFEIVVKGSALLKVLKYLLVFFSDEFASEHLVSYHNSSEYHFVVCESPCLVTNKILDLSKLLIQARTPHFD